MLRKKFEYVCASSYAKILPILSILSSSSRIIKNYTTKVRRRKEIFDNREWVEGKGKSRAHKHIPFGNLVLTRLITFIKGKKGVVSLLAISMTVSSPIMHIWGHLLHTLTQQNSSKETLRQRVEDFPWIFSAIAFHCVVISFYVFWLKKEITIVVDISTRFNANKSIIYNSRTDLSSSGWCLGVSMQKWWENLNFAM